LDRSIGAKKYPLTVCGHTDATRRQPPRASINQAAMRVAWTGFGQGVEANPSV